MVTGLAWKEGCRGAGCEVERGPQESDGIQLKRVFWRGIKGHCIKCFREHNEVRVKKY